ncbi:hypothetical protein Tco_1042959 [Tanacetum coccineum]|uniref:Uncharacterized protein n=1 Tax=Tanacetum coccineum TaxID=301880 RepID=A0ABQ5GM26_9ASTR
MPSTPGGIESSCLRNASISSIRNHFLEGVKDGERESIGKDKQGWFSPAMKQQRLNKIWSYVWTTPSLDVFGAWVAPVSNGVAWKSTPEPEVEGGITIHELLSKSGLDTPGAAGGTGAGACNIGWKLLGYKSSVLTLETMACFVIGTNFGLALENFRPFLEAFYPEIYHLAAEFNESLSFEF